MHKNLKLAVISSVISLAGFGLNFMYDEFYVADWPGESGFVFLGVGMAAAVTGISAWLSVILSFFYKKIRKSSPNKYLVFGIVNIVLGCVTAAYGAYDMYNDVGFMAGLRGYLTIILIVPVFVLLLIADCAVWFIHKKKRKNSRP